MTNSEILAGSNGGQQGTTYDGARSMAVNLWYIPVRSLSIGVEYPYEERKNLNGQRTDENRIRPMFQYDCWPRLTFRDTSSTVSSPSAAPRFHDCAALFSGRHRSETA